MRKNAGMKSSRVQEGFFGQLSVLFFKGRFGKGGFTAELIPLYSSSSLSTLILRSVCQKHQSYLCALIPVCVNLETDFDLLAQYA